MLRWNNGQRYVFSLPGWYLFCYLTILIQQYEEKYMVPNEQSHILANTSLDFLMARFPTYLGIRSTLKSIVVCFVDDRTREAMMWVLNYVQRYCVDSSHSFRNSGFQNHIHYSEVSSLVHSTFEHSSSNTSFYQGRRHLYTFQLTNQLLARTPHRGNFLGWKLTSRLKPRRALLTPTENFVYYPAVADLTHGIILSLQDAWRGRGNGFKFSWV